jgi:4-hydroxy-3-methylbut-2-enyl diphosphate reductase
LHLELPKAVKLVGITAGASTPKNIIEEVQKHVRTII